MEIGPLKILLSRLKAKYDGEEKSLSSLFSKTFKPDMQSVICCLFDLIPPDILSNFLDDVNTETPDVGGGDLKEEEVKMPDRDKDKGGTDAEAKTSNNTDGEINKVTDDPTPGGSGSGNGVPSSSAARKRRICGALMDGKTCPDEAGCGFRHPIICSNASHLTGGHRPPSCKLWHLQPRRTGNRTGRTGPSSSSNLKGNNSKHNGKSGSRSGAGMVKTDGSKLEMSNIRLRMEMSEMRQRQELALAKAQVRAGHSFAAAAALSPQLQFQPTMSTSARSPAPAAAANAAAPLEVAQMLAAMAKTMSDLATRLSL
jgi:hypothetical protein